MPAHDSAAHDPLLAAIDRSPAFQDLLRRALDAQRRSTRELWEDRGGEEAEELIEALAADAMARAQRGVDASPEAARRACARGCSFCCVLRVVATPLEGLAAAICLRKTYKGAELAEVEGRLRANVTRLAALQPAELRKPGPACALLSDEQACLVHAARPLTCRGHNSASASACEESFRDGAGPTYVPIDVPAKVWTLGVHDGLRMVLEPLGLDMRPYEWNSLVLRALTVSDAALRWLRREPVFTGCLVVQSAAEAKAPVSETPAPLFKIAPAGSSGVARNAPCPCGSGKKYKACCGRARS